ncbi:MAG TPA: hypothetical protein VGD69_28245 [Herpetosiphonaceae bacterium]
MISTKTFDQLAAELLGNTILEALDHVDIVEDEPLDAATVTVDELAEQYLKPTANKAWKRVDLKAEGFVVDIDIQQRRFRVQMQGLSLLVLVLVIAVLGIGVDPVQSWLQLILNAQ